MSLSGILYKSLCMRYELSLPLEMNDNSMGFLVTREGIVVFVVDILSLETSFSCVVVEKLLLSSFVPVSTKPI